MKPQEIKNILKESIDSVISSETSPSELSNKLYNIISEVENHKEAASVNKLLEREFNLVMEGFQNIIDKLTKMAKSLNPQDESKFEIEHMVAILINEKDGINQSFRNLGSINI